jgi:hypothetical protein
MTIFNKDSLRGEQYLKVFYCYGCQSCWYETPDGTVAKHPHILSVEVVTDKVRTLLERENENS